MLEEIIAWAKRFFVGLVAVLKAVLWYPSIMVLRIRHLWLRFLGVGCLLLLIVAMVNNFQAESKPNPIDAKIVWMEHHVKYIMTQLQIHSEKLEDLNNLNTTPAPPKDEDDTHPLEESTAVEEFKFIQGSKTAEGLMLTKRKPLALPLIKQLMPHLLRDRRSIIPAYHMNENRKTVEIVMGIPSVKRDKESYLLITLTHIVKGLNSEELKNTLIVVFVGETEMQYVLDVASAIEKQFPKEVNDGLIEVLSPSQAYYPNMSIFKPTLGDSFKRARWRTKQNLDAIYLMAYAQAKGVFYLMLEDDVIAKERFLQQIKQFIAEIAAANSNWEILNYCDIGGIGKLFKASTLIQFVSYLQLFFTSMPIDWLIEGYVADRACGLDKTSNHCKMMKAQLYPHYNGSLFTHIGLFSSLKGKMHKVHEPHSIAKSFYPHHNPPATVSTDIEAFGSHSLNDAYKGIQYFLGVRPRALNYMEITFQKPTSLNRFFFRSGNQEHQQDIFQFVNIYAMPAVEDAVYILVGTFDEFGMAEGSLSEMGPLSSIRLVVTKTLSHWILLSEIELEILEKKKKKSEFMFVPVDDYKDEFDKPNG